jgi:hypothetical protein
MVDCSQFLDGYSEYRDGELPDEVRRQFDAHRAECPSCSRYDRVIDEGVKLYLKCPEVTPSDDFLPRLQHRLYHLEEEMKGPGRRGSGTQAAVTLALAATIAAIAWIPATRSSPQMVELPAVAARAPLPPPPEPVFLPPDPFPGVATVGLGGWRLEAHGGASDLFLAGSGGGPTFVVQPVLQR